MKVIELMIGDWVVDGKKTAQITGIFCDDLFETTLSPSVGGDCIEPIPLTREILEKNGFKHSMPHNDWTNVDCNFYLYEGGNGYRIQNTDIELDYVHQLQHLLRLCNIDKDIKL